MPPSPSLSPSRALDWKSCPQRFKFRAIDRLPEPRHPAAATGSLVHAVLEDLLRGEAETRTPETAERILLRSVSREGTEWDGLAPDKVDEARRFVANYFEMEDPRTVRPRRLEWKIQAEVDGTVYRGIIDRMDESGELVDFKTGRMPGERFEMAAFFGLRFYAYLVWRVEKVIVPRIRLMYLDRKEVLTLDPHEQMIDGFGKQVEALSKAIGRGVETGRWPPRPGAICQWCAFVELCPAWKDKAIPWKEN